MPCRVNSQISEIRMWVSLEGGIIQPTIPRTLKIPDFTYFFLFTLYQNLRDVSRNNQTKRIFYQCFDPTVWGGGRGWAELTP